MRAMILLLLLAACDSDPNAWKTPEGCQIFMTSEMQHFTDACQAAYYEELARQKGQPITRCFQTGGGMSCTTS